MCRIAQKPFVTVCKDPRSAPPSPAHAGPAQHSHRAATAPARREYVKDLKDALTRCLLFLATNWIIFARSRMFDETWLNCNKLYWLTLPIVLVNKKNYQDSVAFVSHLRDFVTFGYASLPRERQNIGCTSCQV